MQLYSAVAQVLKLVLFRVRYQCVMVTIHFQFYFEIPLYFWIASCFIPIILLANQYNCFKLFLPL